MDRVSRIASALGAIGDQSGSELSAAVAAILTAHDDPSLLFIQRVQHDGDPWSGHIAFPGGRIEPTDASAVAAAKRETMEEVALDLGDARALGRLADITGSTIPVCVSCHVFGIEEIPELDPNEEVADTFAVSLSELANPDRHVHAEFEIKGNRTMYPAIDLGIEGKPLLWGLTYRFVDQILQHAELKV